MAKEKKENIVEVLYQKIGSRWYSFFVIDEEVFMGSVPNEAIEDLRPEGRKQGRNSERGDAIKTRIRSS